MAFQTGHIKLSGTFDDLSFYNSVFGWLVRTKGGPSRKQFKSSPSFARARENSSEFTACSRMAASVRRIVFIHTANKDKTLYHRLIKLMRQLANDDLLSLRGQRDPAKGMLSPGGQNRLREFEITKRLSLYDILLATDFLKTEREEQNTEPLARRLDPGSSKKRRARKRPRIPSSPGKQKLFPVMRRIIPFGVASG